MRLQHAVPAPGHRPVGAPQARPAHGRRLRQDAREAGDAARTSRCACCRRTRASPTTTTGPAARSSRSATPTGSLPRCAHDRLVRPRRDGLHGPDLRGVPHPARAGRPAACRSGAASGRRPWPRSSGSRRDESLAALLARPDVEAVVITSPHTAHRPQAEAAAAAGKHVYIEKPMSVSVAECDAIIDGLRCGRGQAHGQLRDPVPARADGHEAAGRRGRHRGCPDHRDARDVDGVPARGHRRRGDRAG